MKQPSQDGPITIPELFCPFPALVNPHYEYAQERSVQWAKDFNLLRNKAAIRRFSKARYGLLSAMVHPTARKHDLSLVSKWHVWLFMFDDQFDEGIIGRNPEGVRSAVDHFLSVISGKGVRPRGPLARSLAFFWRRIKSITSAEWQNLFFKDLAEYFDVYIWEAHNRVRKRIPDLQAFIDHRWVAGAMPTVFDLIEPAHRFHLPREVYDCSQFRRLQRVAGNVVCWHNDIFSLEKERARGDLHNLVLVMRQAHRCSIRKAITLAADLCDAEVRTFLEEERRLPYFSPDVNGRVRTYVADLRNWMRGNLEFSCKTSRYSAVERPAPGQQASFVERLLPQ